MVFWKSKRSPLTQDDEEWQLACWPWLFQNVIDLESVRQGRLILPDDEFFPRTSTKGKDRATYAFQCVAQHAGVADWPFELVEQDERVNPVVDKLLVVQNAPQTPLGTFSVQPDRCLQITYSPELVENPIELIATFAHEICHALMLAADRTSSESELPGGWECEEFATDLLVVLLGFGIFGANSAFEFRQYSDMGTGMQGWSASKKGYLTEAEWAFALAVYLKITNQPDGTIKNWLKPGLSKLLAKSISYLNRNEALLQPLTG